MRYVKVGNTEIVVGLMKELIEEESRAHREAQVPHAPRAEDVRKRVDNVIIRNHMPYTYMPLILCDLPDDAVDAYIVEVSRQS